MKHLLLNLSLLLIGGAMANPPRTLPHNREAEEAVLGGILLTSGAALEDIDLKPKELYAPANQEVLRAARALHAQGKPVDPVTLEAHLRAAGKLSRAGGVAAIAELSSRTPTAANITFHANLVREDAARRTIIRASAEAAAEAYAGSAGPDDLAQGLITTLERAMVARGRWQTIQEVLQDLMPRLQERTEARDRGDAVDPTPMGRPTYFEPLDLALTGGLPFKNPTLIAGDTGSGKSSLVNRIARGKALDMREVDGQMMPACPCTIATLEDRAQAFALRTIAALQGLSNKALQNLDADRNEFEQVVQAANRLFETNVHFLEDIPQGVRELCGMLRQRIRQTGSRLTVVDYQQLVPAGAGQPHDQHAADFVFSELVRLARRLDTCSTIIVSTLNKRDTRWPPTIEDLPFSQARYGTHTGVFVYRPLRDWPVAELHMVKQKQGGGGRIVVGFDQTSVEFHPIDDQDFLDRVTEQRQQGMFPELQIPGYGLTVDELERQYDEALAKLRKGGRR